MVSCPLHVGRWYVNELIRHLLGLILSPGGWLATLFSPASSRITPDLTSIILPWYKRSFYERLSYQ